MQIIDEDISRLVPEQDQLEPETRRERVKEALNFEKYVPDSTPNSPVTDYYNPAIEGYQRTHDWSDNGWKPVDNLTPPRRFQEYIPTDVALETLIDHSPVLEIGAGNGYLSHIINENGGTASPVDISPEPSRFGIVPDEYPHKYTLEGEDGSREYTSWMNVQQSSHEIINYYSERTVVLCHPDGADRWTEEVLDFAADNGQRVIFIGEWFPGQDATPNFFRKLDTEWSFVDRFPVYDWASMHAAGYVFEP